MAPSRTLLVVLAGGAGGRLELLTDHRAKPAVPFGAVYRLIDFALSNASHAGIRDVWVIEQFHPASIQDHLANGRPWDLDRTNGGLLTLHPALGSEREGWHDGTADALWRQAKLIRDFDPEHLVVVSADAVYALDYDAVVREHAAAGADLTMVTTTKSSAEASRYGVVEVDGGGRVTGYAYKPDEPASELVTTEVFVFRPAALLDTLERLEPLARQNDEGLRDLGHEVLPALVRAGNVREYRFERYWQDVGTVAAYHAAQLDLVADEPPIRLDDPAWPIRTANASRGAARVDRGAIVADALLAPGCRVRGSVTRSVLSAGVLVERGAEVIDSVLLDGAVVRAGARVRGAILDAHSVIGAGASVGFGARTRGDGDGDGDGDGIVLIGAGVTVPDVASIAPGARVPATDE